MDSQEAKPIPGTEGGVGPVFSPDAQWLGFFADEKLKKIPLSGGVAQTLADAPASRGASWGSRGLIVFAPSVGALQEVSNAGGSPQQLTHLEKGESTHVWPEFLPGSKAIVFEGRSGVEVQSIVTGQRRTLIRGGACTCYFSSGRLVYWQASSLMAVPFDPQRFEVSGTPVRVVQNVLRAPTPQYSVSATGSLIYVSGGAAQALQSKLVWVSRNGVEQPLDAPAGVYGYPRLSPDGRRVAVDTSSTSSTQEQISLFDVARETLTRFTFEGSVNVAPVWTPDGKRIAFGSDKDGPLNIYWEMADGSGGLERLTPSEYPQGPYSWSPNGELLAFGQYQPGPEIWVLRLSDRKAQPFLQTPAVSGAAQFSPDGRWMAYVSDESGRQEIYVQPYPGPGGKWQISTGGGNEPIWNRNGRELFYRSGDKLMAVDVTSQPSFSVGKTKMLFEGRYVETTLTFPFYDVSPDGQKFLMLKPTDQKQPALTQINVVLNWTEELKRLVPTGK
jgi:serine/threonine-protein kinase